MKILLVAATEEEIRPLIPFIKGEKDIDYLITGIGMVATAYSLSKKLNQKQYNLALNLGIAGSYNRNLKIGDVVNIINDSFSEMGADDGENFLPLYKLELEPANDSVFSDGQIVNTTTLNNKALSILKKVKSISVNTINGDIKKIKKIVATFNPDIETMEGCAFMYVCEKEKMPYFQLRSISNYIEHRYKLNWNIPLAVDNLTKTATEIINELITKD